MKIGVFDSGVGGQSVATALSVALPEQDVIFAHDNEHVPYGTKTEEQLFEYSLPILQGLGGKDCKLIVVACNSLSTTILDKLQAKITVPLIGVEPMISQASTVTKTGIIAVCATPRTLASNRYRELCRAAANCMFVEPDCSEWALMIEQDMIDRTKIKISIEDALDQGADVIILGCTHYHWIESLIKSIVGNRAVVLQPEEQIIDRVKLAIEQLG
jgi:glutamate racemase